MTNQLQIQAKLIEKLTLSKAQPLSCSNTGGDLIQIQTAYFSRQASQPDKDFNFNQLVSLLNLEKKKL
jgi:hypothetical protein